ncbi:MAG: DNA-protecting protein DprA [Candidatus Zambryskibacteria bacterium CG11_big_fil_rev_8_21_14_0_20_40_24]|uniref:DNA-protecting protein DprA n=1 Tax=Candidatus Zambryskibacteria bacterium CG11_big_fil_rev_8_21_14_0_20_40_24 TaxID=1975116 RepID=A0A2H0K6C2_9BACT|nr:MAG: DNA-protecting protein DprA [Candidatus Zambryskibacteria bacterium CG11_big_fil_rev_8_21_14_0_20_40_24]
MSYSIRKLKYSEFPPLLKEIPDPPKELFCAGTLPAQDNKLLSVVGSRKVSGYGRDVCEKLILEIAQYPISIVSGLALGVDSIAHKAALKNKMHAIAIPGSGLDPSVLYPRSHLRLAEEVVESGGTLLSEFEPEFKATIWSFPKRNRIMAGISHATLIIEAEKKSGTLITSRLALDYNREVIAVPGSIFSPGSEGPNELLRLGAQPARSGDDILRALGIEAEEKSAIKYDSLSENEKIIIELLKEPRDRDDIIREIGLPASQVNMILSAMEIKGYIKESMGEMHLNI